MPCGSGSYKEPEVILPAVSAPPPSAPSPPLVHPAARPHIPTLSLPPSLRETLSLGPCPGISSPLPNTLSK